MCERRLWTQEEDQIIKKIVGQNDHKDEGQKENWTEIAKKLNKKLPQSNRTGKQCRQRWYNQLDPSIKDQDWSQTQIQNLFSLQNQHGNKWSFISKRLPGRTDNNVKNFFYSSLRRAIRKVNQYIAQYKKKSNIKPFKPNLLTKILSISDQSHRDRLDIKNSKAIKIAQEVKNMLARLSQEHENQQQLNLQDKKLRQKLVNQIKEFNKNCKKKKGKKAQSQENIRYQEQQEERDHEVSEEEQVQYSSISEEPQKTNLRQRNQRKSLLKKKDYFQIIEEEPSEISRSKRSRISKRKSMKKQEKVTKHNKSKIEEEQPLFKIPQPLQNKPSLQKKKSSFVQRKNSNQSNGFFKNNNNSAILPLFEQFGNSFEIDVPQMITRKSSVKSPSPFLTKKTTSDFNTNNINFSFLDSRDYLLQKMNLNNLSMKNLDSSSIIDSNSKLLFKKDSKISKKQSL